MLKMILLKISGDQYNREEEDGSRTIFVKVACHIFKRKSRLSCFPSHYKAAHCALGSSQRAPSGTAGLPACVFRPAMGVGEDWEV